MRLHQHGSQPFNECVFTVENNVCYWYVHWKRCHYFEVICKSEVPLFSPSMTGLGGTMATYEQVVKINPQLERPRPVVLVAPRGGPFDMKSLRDRLVQEHPALFGCPIPREKAHLLY